MALPALGQLFKFARDTQDLYKLHETVKATIMALDGRLRAVEDRLIQLEAEQGQIVSEAKSAATGAATMIASAVIADAVTRIEKGLNRVSVRNSMLAAPSDAALRTTAPLGDFGISG
ncbi:MAG TPA: hypothetical protein VGM42_07165 [Rhodopila sp.]